MPAIKGRVTSKRGASIGAPTVELINPTGDIVDQVQVDADGRFALNVSPGTWNLKTYDPQGQRGEASVSVGDDDAVAELLLA